MSKGGSARFAASHSSAPVHETRAPASPHSRVTASMASAARRSLSTNVTCAAPRDRASSPSAPLPANKSSTRALSMRGCSQLNRVSRTRSGVGRISTPAGNRSRRPRCRPAMMRRTRERAPAFRAPLTASLDRATTRVFPLFLGFGKDIGSGATGLPPFGAQAYATALIRQVRRIVLHGEGMRPTLPKQNSKERTHEEANCSHCPGCHRDGGLLEFCRQSTRRHAYRSDDRQPRSTCHCDAVRPIARCSRRTRASCPTRTTPISRRQPACPQTAR